MTKTWEAGTPIIDPNGKIVARLNCTMNVTGDVWKWACFNTEAAAVSKVGASPVDEATGPNEAALYEVFRRGEFVVLSYMRLGSTEGMFSHRRWFTEPDAPISEEPEGKLAALKVLRDDLQLTLRTVLSDAGAWLDHLQRRYEWEAKREGGGE